MAKQEAPVRGTQMDFGPGGVLGAGTLDKQTGQMVKEMLTEQHKEIDAAKQTGKPGKKTAYPKTKEDLVKMGYVEAMPGVPHDVKPEINPMITGETPGVPMGYEPKPRETSEAHTDTGMIPREDLLDERKKRQELEGRIKDLMDQNNQTQGQLREMQMVMMKTFQEGQGVSNVKKQETAVPDPSKLFALDMGEDEEFGEVTPQHLNRLARQLGKGVTELIAYRDDKLREQINDVKNAFVNFGTDQYMEKAQREAGFPEGSERANAHKFITAQMLQWLPDHMKGNAHKGASKLIQNLLNEHDAAKADEAKKVREQAERSHGASPASIGTYGAFQPKVLKPPTTMKEAEALTAAYCGVELP